MQNTESEEKLPLSDEDDTKMLGTSLPYSSEQDRYISKKLFIAKSFMICFLQLQSQFNILTN